MGKGASAEGRREGNKKGRVGGGTEEGKYERARRRTA